MWKGKTIFVPLIIGQDVRTRHQQIILAVQLTPRFIRKNKSIGKHACRKYLYTYLYNHLRTGRGDHEYKFEQSFLYKLSAGLSLKKYAKI